MFLKFVNRKEELEFLEERYRLSSFEFFVIYGRRRVGKTELIKEFVQKKPHLYFLCDRGGTQNNLSRLRKKVGEFLEEPPLASENWEELFTHLVKRVKEKKMPKLIIAFDEFSYLVEKDDAVPSFFQVIIDEILKPENIMLILLGSSVSMMEKGVLSSKSPLYGRKTAHLRVEPIKFRHYPLFFPDNDFKKNLEFHAVLGGVPFYMIQFSESKNTFLNINEEILSRRGHLYEEIDFLLKEEFREPAVYRNIMEAVNSGCSKLVEIANKSNIPVQDMDRYLKSLMNIGLLHREVPITEKNSKRSVYSIKDNFFRFWFYFCEPFKSNLALGELSLIQKKINGNFNHFVARCFEEVIRNEYFQLIFPDFKQVGGWWGHWRENGQRKELEIDFCAINDESKKILFGECKWQEKVDAKKVLAELKEKATHVDWHNQQRKESYAIFAKSFKEQVKMENVHLFDLRDLNQILKR